MLKITAVVQGSMSVSLGSDGQFARLGLGHAGRVRRQPGVRGCEPSVRGAGHATTLSADTSGSMIRYGGGVYAVFVGRHIELGRAGEELLLHALLLLLCVRPAPRRRRSCAGCSTSCCAN